MSIFCINCRHHKAPSILAQWGENRARFAKCYAPEQISGYGLVDPQHDRGSYCVLNRQDKGRCGEEGRWYSPARTDE